MGDVGSQWEKEGAAGMGSPRAPRPLSGVGYCSHNHLHPEKSFAGSVCSPAVSQHLGRGPYPTAQGTASTATRALYVPARDLKASTKALTHVG